MQVGADGQLQFRPHPGRIQDCDFPEEANVEIIAAAAPGKVDLAVLRQHDRADHRAHGGSPSGLEKLRDYLSRVKVTGISTNIPLLTRILADDVFHKGVYDTNYLPAFLARIDGAALIRHRDGRGEASGGIDLDTIRIDGSNELKVLARRHGDLLHDPDADRARLRLGRAIASRCGYALPARSDEDLHAA